MISDKYFHNATTVMKTIVLCTVQDLKDSVTRISKFVGKSLTSEVIGKIADRCVFKNMKQNKMSNYSLVPVEFMDQSKSEFLRKGVSQYYIYFVLFLKQK